VTKLLLTPKTFLPMLKNNSNKLLPNSPALTPELKLDKLKEIWNMKPGQTLMLNTKPESTLVKMLLTF